LSKVAEGENLASRVRKHLKNKKAPIRKGASERNNLEGFIVVCHRVLGRGKLGKTTGAKGKGEND